MYIVREYWLIARDGWLPEKQLVAGPWYGRKGRREAKKRFTELKPTWLSLTMVKAVKWE